MERQPPLASAGPSSCEKSTPWDQITHIKQKSGGSHGKTGTQFHGRDLAMGQGSRVGGVVTGKEPRCTFSCVISRILNRWVSVKCMHMKLFSPRPPSRIYWASFSFPLELSYTEHWFRTQEAETGALPSGGCNLAVGGRQVRNRKTRQLRGGLRCFTGALSHGL